MEKTKAEAKNSEAVAAGEITETVLLLIQPLKEENQRMKTEWDKERKEMKELRTEVEALREEIGYYRKGVAKLIRQLVTAGIEPEFAPRKGGKHATT